jgi:ATP-dependent RNA helicase DDX3X
VLAPTRELAVQIHQDALRLTYGSPFRAAAVYGGASAVPQLNQMGDGAHIMVATPGRLSDFLERGVISLAWYRFLVLAEDARLLDMGFEPQVRDIMFNHDLRKADDGLQTLMFSATMPSNIRRLTHDLMSDVLAISVGRVGATSDLVKQELIPVNYTEKEDKVADLIDANEKTLMFTNKKSNCDWLVRMLNRRGISAVAIHGDLAQRAREYSIHAFKSGRASVLVGTDVAARGLDIPNVKHVINYDLPPQIDDYVHRIGRTGRAGNTGKATSFVCRGSGQDGDDKILPDLVKTLTESKEEVPDWLNDYVESIRGRQQGYSGHRRSRPGRWGRRGERGSSHFRDSYGNNPRYGGRREERGWDNRNTDGQSPFTQNYGQEQQQQRQNHRY